MGSLVLLCVLGALFICPSSAGWAGREFALSFMENFNHNAWHPHFQLFITAVQANTRVAVQVRALGFKQEKYIKTGEKITISLPTRVEMYGSRKSFQTVLITASADVTVTSYNYRPYTADTSVVYPISKWGTEYFIYTPSRPRAKEFAVTNGKTDNRVEIYPQYQIMFEGRKYQRGQQLVIDLKPYESALLQSHLDLSGTRVASQHPVAVFTGHTCLDVFTKCDHVYEQLQPVSAWGSSFIVPPLSYQTKYDSVYVQSSQPTQVTVNDGKLKYVFTLGRGEVKELRLLFPKTLFIKANHGIQVLMLFNGVVKDKKYYDPFLMSILPTDHTCSSYSLETIKGFNNQALIVAKTRTIAELRFNGRMMSRDVKWTSVPDTGFSWAKIDLNNLSATSRSQTLSSSGSNFALYSVGFAQRTGYGSFGQCIQPGDCSSTTCSANEMCEMKGSYPTCVPRKSGTCWAVGDPHHKTFDGRRFDFMGTCTYVFAKNSGKDGHLPAFEVLVQNENRGSLRVSYVALVTVKVYDITVSVARSETGRVRIDNSHWTLPAALNKKKLVVFQSGRSAVIETDFGLTVRYDWEQSLVITLSDKYRGKTSGLCGNFNDNPDDDFTTPSGTQAGGVVAFGSSWKVPGLTKDAACRDDCVGGCGHCQSKVMKKWEGASFCGLITQKNGPFSKCHAVIDPQVYMENCKFDVCMGKGLRHFLCKALETYSEACQIAGFQVQDWRRISHCPLKCPKNSHYELCASACPATCSDPDASTICTRQCVETCTCNAGFVLSGNKCVPAAKCGCTTNGRYIPAGESFWADQGCQTLCQCIGGRRQVQCKKSKGCGAGKQCQVVDGIRKCQPISYSVCHATGDPHLSSFDKKRFDFQGTCVYQMVSVCSKNTELVPFEVLLQNEHRGRKTVSFTKLVEIKVYSISIVITKTHKGGILVNNELVNLPVTLENELVSVFKSGSYAVVTTTFGLTVVFNWENAVYVRLPSNYMGAVCGLCGNYNGDREDDLTPKNGGKPVSAAEFGASWRVAEIPGCVDGCKGTCPSCDITQKVQYEKRDFCGILTDPKGPFRDCHGKVDPKIHFEDCVYDICLYKSRNMLCEAISSYTSACQAEGGMVHSWRSRDFCPMKCPVHSHYDVCSTSCSATCKDLAPPQNCQAHCVEGCTCDEGYILSGDVCVPFSQCGCIYGDRYYRLNQVFYPSQRCEEKCKCMQDGMVACSTFRCGPNEKCKIENGVQKCHPVGKGVCQASGDPHYTTYDGQKYDFQGTCTYTLSSSCGLEGTHLEAFSVHVENVQWDRVRNRKVVSVTKLIALEVYNFTLIMRHKMSGIMVNGVFNDLPLNLNEGAVQVYQDGQRYVIATDFGLVVTYDRVYHVRVTVPGNYRGKTCGLCGNFNGDKKDDFQKPNGHLARNVNKFGESWKVNIPNVVCENGCQGNNCPDCNPARKAVFLKSTYCGIMTAPNGPFAICHSKLGPQPQFDDCVFDLCASNGDGKVLCDSIAAYAFNCHKAGVDIKNWRTPSFCPMKCPANSHYEVCADACSVSCPGLTDIVECPTSCTEGCECDEGFLFNGLKCVQETECGCYDNGRSYKSGAVVYDDDCGTKCTCDPAKGLLCEDHSCPLSTKCMIRKGIRACYNEDPCKDAKCRVKEKCKVEKGEAVCVPEYTGICWAWGDPHYHTLDGYNFDFQGTCKYVISKTCGNLDGLVPFSVTERNENRGNRAVSYVREVDVSVYGYNITIRKNQVGQVTVDGELLNLPVQMGESQLSVLQHGRNAVVRTDFGLIVSYDWNTKLVIKLPSSFYGSVCGLCGNFNGNSHDELQNPAGKAVSSVIEWAKSWQMPEQDKDHPCSDTCEKNCPTCDSSQVELYKSDTFCGVLTTRTNNVFQKCHAKLDPQAFMDSCVYDVCLNKGDKKMLCQALASYSQQCQEEGIVIKGWRKTFGCPMDCQRHSHYEECAIECQPSCPFIEEKPICTSACVETCVCDKGYVLSAGVCVPATKCGCSYEGRYYKPGQRFWADEACSRQCECDTTLGMVACREASCSAKEKCTVVDGERACRPISHATCVASGDPHFRSLDGRRFDFQGTCVYQLVGLCSQQPGLVPFNVTVQNDHRGRKSVSYTQIVTLSIYDITLTISREYPYKVLLNGQLALVPLDYNDQLVVSRSGRKAVVKTVAGITMTFDWRSAVRVTLPSNYQGAVCGLCGNYNGNAGDDMTMPNGQAASNGDELGKSWQVGVVPGCSSVCQGPWCQACSKDQWKQYQAPEYCGTITDTAGPFRDCHKHVNPAPYLQDCIYDACQYHGHRGTICDSVALYVSACQSQGITIYSWRKDDFCPMECPANSHYALCATDCPPTCSSLAYFTTCHSPCTETCECDQGYLLSGETCVPVKDCGCTYDGRYYGKGDVFYPESECDEKCSCGENGAVSCQKERCRKGETCKLVKGVKGCHPEGQAKCVASGDTHYTSFDGQKFDIQGTCVYILAKVCDNDKGDLTPFVVTQANEKYGNGEVSVTSSVTVTVYGHVIYIQQGIQWKVTLDDEVVNLPLYLDDGRLRVTQEGRSIIVRTDFGLKVLYDTVYYVEVIVPSTYQRKMCGLCGNYDTKPHKDFRLPSGRETNKVDDFGKAWVVDMPSQGCGGCGKHCPVCAQAKTALFGKDSCGIISAPDGPFKACHSKINPKSFVSDCVFDVCAAGGSKDTLCNNVQAYVLACQNTGGQIEQWRSSTFCPALCPKHSHYELCAETSVGTCASFNNLISCSESCFEGCQCDDGLVFDGLRCVQMDNCGCVYKGRYLMVDQAVVNKDCTSRCVCHKSNLVKCESLSCTNGEVCGVEKGVRGCHSKEGHCNINQYGNFTSFDGMSGKIATEGTLDVASVCDEKEKLWFRVAVDIYGKGAATAVAAIHVFFKEIAIAVNNQQKAWINGKEVSLPSKVMDDVSVKLSEKTVIIERAPIVRVTFSVSQEVNVTIDSSFAGKMCGICGNYNNDPDDDKHKLVVCFLKEG